MRIVTIARSAKKWMIRYCQGSRANIAFAGIRRGGSSLLADLIASQRGIWFANEPFAVFPGHSSERYASRYLPRLPHSQFFGLDSEHDIAVRRYMALLNRGAIPIGTCRRTKFPLRADRVCLKILNAPFLTDDFVRRDGMIAIFLVRHPAAQALSVLRLGWGFSAEAYFERPDFLRLYLTDEQIEFGSLVLRNGTDWEKAILNWVVETLFPLKHARELSLCLTYEELVLVPEVVIPLLCRTCGFDDPELMRRLIARPSGSSWMSTRDTMGKISSRDRWALVASWEHRVDGHMRAVAQNVLDRMGVITYRMDDPLAARRWQLHHLDLQRARPSL